MTAEELMAAIQSDRVTTRAAAAREYAQVIAAYLDDPSSMSNPSQPKIAQLNDAILKRWSASGLDWIKREAWKIHSRPTGWSCSRHDGNCPGPFSCP